mgnify:CR=1 FL=1
MFPRISTLSLNPLYIVETLQIRPPEREDAVVAGEDGLNPLYIVETLQMHPWVHHRGAHRGGLNPLYIVETLQIDFKRSSFKVRNRTVLIHSTSWKLFRCLKVMGIALLASLSLNPLYIVETLQMQGANGNVGAGGEVLIHSTSWKLFRSAAVAAMWRYYNRRLNPLYIVETLQIMMAGG